VTVTEKLALRVLPCASVALQLTAVVPTANADPDAGAHTVAIGPSTVSDADAVKVTAVVGPVASNVRSAGTVTVGDVVSVTVTVKDPVALLPCGSVAVQLTAVAATLNPEPDAGEQSGAIGPSIGSTADTL
jgi:hypothetical protein